MDSSSENLKKDKKNIEDVNFISHKIFQYNIVKKHNLRVKFR